MNRFWIAFVCIASLLDAGFTDLGLRENLIHEANPLMKHMYEASISLFYAFKLVLPLSLFYLVSKAGKRLLLNNLIRFSALVYAGILLLHFYWITAAIQLTI